MPFCCRTFRFCHWIFSYAKFQCMVCKNRMHEFSVNFFSMKENFKKIIEWKQISWIEYSMNRKIPRKIWAPREGKFREKNFPWKKNPWQKISRKENSMKENSIKENSIKENSLFGNFMMAAFEWTNNRNFLGRKLKTCVYISRK